MKDFEICVKNLSTHRFLSEPTRKRVFVLNVAAHKFIPLCPVLEGSHLKAVFHMMESSVSIIVFLSPFSKIGFRRQFHLLLTKEFPSNNRCKINIITITYLNILSTIIAYFIDFCIIIRDFFEICNPEVLFQ